MRADLIVLAKVLLHPRLNKRVFQELDGMKELLNALALIPKCVNYLL